MDQTAGNGRATLTVPMVDPEIVKHLRALKALGWVLRSAPDDGERDRLTDGHRGMRADRVTPMAIAV